LILSHHQRDVELTIAKVTLTKRRIIMDRVLRTVTKNSREEIRIGLTDFHGRQVIDIRVFYPGPDGEWRPTKKGFGFTSEKLPRFINALQETAKLLDEDGTGLQEGASD
jgi:hypothetical protein